MAHTKHKSNQNDWTNVGSNKTRNLNEINKRLPEIPHFSENEFTQRLVMSTLTGDARAARLD